MMIAKEVAKELDLVLNWPLCQSDMVDARITRSLRPLSHSHRGVSRFSIHQNRFGELDNVYVCSLVCLDTQLVVETPIGYRDVRIPHADPDMKNKLRELLITLK